MKYSFRSDYCELAHPEILAAFSAAGSKQFGGYGLDEYSLRAAELIKNRIKVPGADVHFISGGTHANLTVISSILRPHEAVIATELGHIFVHEAGAIEATGHKICTAKAKNGKLPASDIEEIVKIHDDEHMVSPRLVYISQSTEIGTVYTKKELEEIYNTCKKNDLFLFIDGARLAAALNSEACDLTYEEIAKNCDVFYIGGTKNGALYGEAIVIINEALKKDFRINLKLRGALLSKSAAIGIQFEVMFKNDLIDNMALHANHMAKKMGEGIISAGYDLMNPSCTNMLLPIFPFNVAAALRENYEFYDWGKPDAGTDKSKENFIIVRLVTSWATPPEIIDKFINDLSKIY